MPTLKVPDGEIRYEVHGAGYPLMVFAPGGLHSELAFWRHSPSNPSVRAVWMDPTAVLGKKYRLLAMPTVTTGNTTIMIGEKGAAMIREDAAVRTVGVRVRGGAVVT